MTGRLAGKAAMVTGAAQGLGEAQAVAIGAAGGQVGVSGRAGEGTVVSLRLPLETEAAGA